MFLSPCISLCVSREACSILSFGESSICCGSNLFFDAGKVSSWSDCFGFGEQSCLIFRIFPSQLLAWLVDSELCALWDGVKVSMEKSGECGEHGVHSFATAVILWILPCTAAAAAAKTNLFTHV